ncbi:MAG TPA: signal peptidase I [Bacillus sp. (in: firmicutes)]|uniref:signal peptidase I n=1 Tax=Bacillus litorisediminis TaxID=2922713 RepID=UPI001FAC150B|nr:signal peptidase I [Bacillus litorisediminis]HWO77935.1 signal peptidase I [Bacillus sp. (in: firmicutes)]
MEQSKRKKNEIWEWIKAFLIAIGLAIIIRQFFFAPIIVDGFSMKPTLEDHDRMIVNKFSYKFGSPERFDIIVFQAPEGRDYIKRVIGLPGDRIEYKNDVLYINGKPYDEPYLEEFKKAELSGPLTFSFTLEDVIGRETVPEGHVFVMGDNRRFSKDSRHIGAVPFDKILGKTSFVFWPFEDIGFVK